jgi:hypothetical protein
VLDALFAWCDLQKPRVLDESPVAAAIRYAENQKAALYRFLDDGRLPIHNNVSERSLRRQVLGRRNWLFLGSEDGAIASSPCSPAARPDRPRGGVEPVGYIRDLFCLLPSWPKHRALDLAPVNWATTAATEEVAAKLAANRFRQAVLASRA